jgi:hypothetical protein
MTFVIQIEYAHLSGAPRAAIGRFGGGAVVRGPIGAGARARSAGHAGPRQRALSLLRDVVTSEQGVGWQVGSLAFCL